MANNHLEKTTDYDKNRQATDTALAEFLEKNRKSIEQSMHETAAQMEEKAQSAAE